MKETSMEAEAVRTLKRDHKRIIDLLFHFEQSEEPSHKLSFAETLLNELAIHSVIEDELVYPLLEQQDKKKLSKRVHHSRKDHDRMDDLMAQLVELKQVDEKYIQLFSELADVIVDHVKEEEEDLLPALADVATVGLAQELNELKNELLKFDSAKGDNFTPQTILFNRLHERRRTA